MKIERISENQIRCTLSSADLASRQIELTELAYGSDKAKNLFHDMMRQAHKKFGFDSDNSPLMIEAIPVSPDSIVLIITKVDDPEELDTRFSRFTQSQENNPAAEARQFTGADSILDLFKTIAEAKAKVQEAPSECPIKKKLTTAPAPAPSNDPPVDLVQAFLFRSLDDVIAAAHALDHFYTGENSLYKTAGDDYQLVVHQSGTSPERFNKVCNVLSEYGSSIRFVPAGAAHLLEHGDLLLAAAALQKLATI